MRYYMLNKPRGLLSACRDESCETLMSCFPEEEREGLFHVGRLDKDTEGMILITDDGELCKYLLAPKNRVKKSYYFIALGTLSDKEEKKIREGVDIFQSKEEKLTLPAEIEIMGHQPLQEFFYLMNSRDGKRQRARREQPTVRGIITITEGKKHQVRRMLKSVGCYIFYLKRVSIGGVKLDENLKLGEYRALTEEELAILTENMKDSSF